MAGEASVLVTPLTCVLLQRYCDQTPAPDLDTGGSLVLGLASSVWSILTLGYGSGEGGSDNEKTLADISLSLLLLLTNHCTDTSAFKNPFREALFSFANASEKSLDTEAHFRLDYPALFSVLADTLHTEDATLLLYLLLHSNAKFRSYVLAGSEIEQLVIPILQTLYTCTVTAEQASNHHIYMSLIILLIATFFLVSRDLTEHSHHVEREEGQWNECNRDHEAWAPVGLRPRTDHGWQALSKVESCPQESPNTYKSKEGRKCEHDSSRHATGFRGM